MDPNARFPRAWHGLVYGAVVWVPVALALVANARDAQGWSMWDWLITLIIWAIGSFVWMSLCDWAVNRLGRALGWWPS
jgi:hypothetical protein